MRGSPVYSCITGSDQVRSVRLLRRDGISRTCDACSVGTTVLASRDRVSICSKDGLVNQAFVEVLGEQLIDSSTNSAPVESRICVLEKKERNLEVPSG
jgi:hypothetical protein